MAKTDETTTPPVDDAERIRLAVENSKGSGESNDDDAGADGADGADATEDKDLDDQDDAGDDAASGADGSDADNDEDDDDAGDDDGKDTKSGNFRFTQFASKDDPKDQTAYVKNLEEGYQNSSQEAVRLNRQWTAIKQAAAADENFGKAVLSVLRGEGLPATASDLSATKGADKDSDSSDDPLLVDLKRERQEQNEKEAEEFATNNPEVLSDPKLYAEVNQLVTEITQMEYRRSKRLISTGEALEKAFTYLGRTVKKAEKQQLTDKLKKSTAPNRSQKTRKPAREASKLSDLSLSMAEKMGVSKEALAKVKK